MKRRAEPSRPAADDDEVILFHICNKARPAAAVKGKDSPFGVLTQGSWFEL
jgi:hypothetical protein